MYVCMCIYIYIYIYTCVCLYARDISISYCTVNFMSKRSVHVCPTKGAHMYVSWEYESNSGLAQDQSVLVDKTHMVAERFLSLRLPSFSSTPSPFASRTMEHLFVRNFQVAGEEEKSFEAMAMMAAAALTACATFNIGGTIVNFVWDKAKRAWKQEKNSPLTMAVENYALTQDSISMPTSPSKETTDEDADKHIHSLTGWKRKSLD